MAYIGQSIKNGTFTDLGFSGTFNSSTTAFNLGTQVGSAAQLLVSKNGVIQRPGTDYTLATGGTQISFTTAPASGDSIFIVEISGAVGGPMNRDINGDELILDVDGDTSITADTDDQIDIKIGGADDFAFKANKFEVQTGSNVDMNGTELILDADGDTSITADTDDQIDFRAGGTDTMHVINGKVGIGTSSPTTELYVDGAGSGTFSPYNDPLIVEGDSYTIGLHLKGVNSQAMIIYNRDGTNGWFTGLENSGHYKFSPMTAMNGTAVGNAKDDGTPPLTIRTDGDVAMGKTSESFSTKGFFFNIDPGQANFTSNQDSAIRVNRTGNDGDLISLQQAGSQEGTISVSGSTVSYNGFTGTHWSRLADNSKPTILKGTILESLDEMCDWYQVEFDVTDEEGNTTTEKENYALGDGENVGDVITYTYKGTDYQATILKENDIKHSKCKISDSSESKAVYGVFQAWDNDDDTVNDMYVAQTGTFVVRLNSSVTTLNKGDLIQSNGDGTGKVQADDIIRASTVAKVLSTTKIETYSDGSYIVPCSLHC